MAKQPHGHPPSYNARGVARAKLRGHSGASVYTGQYGGYLGAVGGGYAKAKPATASENAAWIKKATKSGLIGKARRLKAVGARKSAALGVGTYSVRRSRGGS